MKIKALKCPVCEDLIFSRALHDYRSCSCGAIAIDGGLTPYNKITWDGDKVDPTKLEWIEIKIKESKKEIYNDWNKRIDKLGLIKKSE